MRRLAPPVVDGRWVRPAPDGPAQPVWGHAKGLRVGLAPLPGPRGLLRIYAPYLGQPPGRMINFIAIEPIPAGQWRRGFSELEQSDLDGVRGKRLWSAQQPTAVRPREPDQPARGQLLREGDLEMLRLFVFVEPFRNGCRVYLRVTFRSDRPYEVGLASFAQPGSRPMRVCVLTATMGNYARLRRLHLARRVVHARHLWPKFHGDGFARHRRFPLPELHRTAQGHVLVAATTDEAHPSQATYAPGTFAGWKYQGAAATQYWRCERPPAQLAVQVNGRTCYWASQSPIPGGIAYENFELVAPFRDGQEFWFGVTPQSPAELGLIDL